MKRITLPLLVALLGMLVLAPLTVQAQSNPLSNIHVTTQLPGGGTFTGVLSIVSLAVNDAGQLLASGTLVGTARVGNVVTAINQTFTDVVATLTQPGQGTCNILFLDLGPIHLDLLGLNIDLSRVVLNITAQQGPGNLLGNLLCALVGLLDNPTANLTAIQALLDVINQLL
jgi:hypothetical protein